MPKVPNQKTIITKKEKCDTKNLYAKINLKALENAMQNLKGETFKLWIYFSKNQDNYTFYLSKVDVLNYGVGSASSYNRGIAELIEKGYLKEVSKEKYNFIEFPQKEEIDQNTPSSK